MITIKAVVAAVEATAGVSLTPKGKAYVHLHTTYPEETLTVKAFMRVMSKDIPNGPSTPTTPTTPKDPWAYFMKDRATLHTDLLDEDYTYYRDNMYPDKEYDI